jgi:hypothetical protein
MVAEAMQGLDVPPPSGASSSSEVTSTTATHIVNPPGGAERSVNPSAEGLGSQEAEPPRSEKDAELEDEIVASIQDGQDPMVSDWVWICVVR